jgi:hypothetical protein
MRALRSNLASLLVTSCVCLLSACDATPNAMVDGGADTDAGIAAPDAGTADAGPPRALFALPRTDDAPLFDLPWPSDVRRTDDGAIDLRAFPNPRSLPLIDRYIETVSARQRGFSTNGSIYFRFSRALDGASLPRTAARSLEPDASVFLIDVDGDSPTRLQRHPVTSAFRAPAGLYRPSLVLAMTPAVGVPLAPGRRYAAVITTRVRTLDGSRLERDDDFRDLLDGSGDGAVSAARSLYADALGAVEESGTAPEEVLAMAVFTTQDPVSDLVTFRQWMSTEFAAPSADDTAWRLALERPGYQEIDGRMGPVPVFQEGDIPYGEVGGRMELGPDGAPTVQSSITLRFAMTVPVTAMPASGYPVVLYAHGTGGDFRSFLSDGTGGRLAELGIATLGIDMIHHGERNTSRISEELLFVNILNPDAARDNIRQNALDFVQVARLVRGGLSVPPGIATREGTAIHFDPARVWFFGHSQGGVVGPVYLAIDDGVSAGVISAGSAVIANALLEKTSPVSIPDVLRLALGLPGPNTTDAFEREGFGADHPVVTMLQGWFDGADPANFGGMIIERPLPGFVPKSVLATEGMMDTYAPPSAIEALAVAMRTPQVGTVVRRIEAFDLVGLPAQALPVSGNVGGGSATAGLLQFPDDGHFAVFNNRTAQRQIQGFFASLRDGPVASIPAP